jgi:uncharacterized protein (DUF2249 family)
MKVSFDFDGTLEHEYVQEYARQLIEEGHEVWVVTTRYDENHRHRYVHNPTLDDLWSVVDKVGIPRHRVRFTLMQYKHHYLNGTQFVWHLDDNEEEFTQARRHKCSVPMVYVLQNNWKDKCNLYLKRETDPDYNE